jgi:bifunctional non-homologous end joining protein LigD
VLLDDPPITKRALAEFYRSIARSILPGLINRPLMLLRCPDGKEGECFFQKHAVRGFPSVVRQVDDRTDGGRWIYIDGLEGLLGLVQMNAIEYHVWGTTVADLNSSDRLIIDLDPGSGVPWTRVIEGALELRSRLERYKLRSFVRTSGGKGLHVMVPLEPAVDWPQVHGFARALAEGMAKDDPRRYLSVAAKQQRSGKIFLDYLRNARGATAVCSYSMRKRPGAPLATPLTWDELPKVTAADQFRFDNIQKRLAHLPADPWAGIDRLTQTLPRLARARARKGR